MRRLEVETQTYHITNGHTNDYYAERESGIGGKEGYFAAFLDQRFLPGYFELLQKRMAKLDIQDFDHLTQITSVMEKIFVPLIETGKAGTVKVTGEIPRSIAVGIPDGYWERFERLHEKQNQLKNSPHPIVREFCNSGLGFSRDPDADITFVDLTVAKVSRLLKKQFGVQRERIHRKGGRETFELFRENGLVVTVDSGPLRTKPDIKLMIIKILDEATGEQIFHMDVGEFPKNVGAVVKDKRVVHATRKHGCQAELSVVNGHLYYNVSPEAVQAMKEPDTIYTRDLWSLYELTTRSMRIACSHPVEGVIDFERFIPQLDRETAFALHNIFRRGKSRRHEIPKDILFFVIKELIVSFDYDHMQAAQMLYDSDISIAGLEELTPEHRNAIFASDSFSVELRNGDKVPQNERDESYLRKQRYLYTKGMDESGHRHHDGIMRFVRALVELEVLPPSTLDKDEWEAFFDLFVEKNPPRIEIIKPHKKETASSKPVEIARVNGPGGIIYDIRRSDGKIVDRGQIEQLAIHIADSLPNWPEGIDQMTNVIQIMRERATGKMKKAIDTYLMLRGKANLSTIQMLDGAEAKNIVYSVGNIFLMLQTNQSGLTPYQMETLYRRLHGRFRKQSFTEAFLELKLLGLVRKIELESTTAQRHLTQPVDFYFIQPEGATEHVLSELISQNGDSEFPRFYKNQLKKAGVNFKESISLEDLVAQLDESRISLEVLESFTEIDFRELIKLRRITKKLKIHAECLREAIRRYYAEKFVDGDYVPDALLLTFNSAAGRDLVQRIRELIPLN